MCIGRTLIVVIATPYLHTYLPRSSRGALVTHQLALPFLCLISEKNIFSAFCPAGRVLKTFFRRIFTLYLENMAGRWQPYAHMSQRDSMADYDPTQSHFDPKAVTRASYMPPPPPKKKPEGPLIDFNKHPDSFLILPYGNTNAKPMSAKTKTFINIARWIQVGLRIATLIGAAGVLLCGIFIRGAQDTEGYIMRIPVRAFQKMHKETANIYSLVWISSYRCTPYTT